MTLDTENIFIDPVDPSEVSLDVVVIVAMLSSVGLVLGYWLPSLLAFLFG